MEVDSIIFEVNLALNKNHLALTYAHSVMEDEFCIFKDISLFREERLVKIRLVFREGNPPVVESFLEDYLILRNV